MAGRTPELLYRQVSRGMVARSGPCWCLQPTTIPTVIQCPAGPPLKSKAVDSPHRRSIAASAARSSAPGCELLAVLLSTLPCPLERLCVYQHAAQGFAFMHFICDLHMRGLVSCVFAISTMLPQCLAQLPYIRNRNRRTAVSTPTAHAHGGHRPLWKQRTSAARYPPPQSSPE